MELNKIEQEIINLFNSEEGKNLAMNLLVSVLEYHRGLKILQEYKPNYLTGIISSCSMLDDYFNVNKSVYDKGAEFYRGNSSSLYITYWYINNDNEYVKNKIYLDTLSSWQELEELIKPYQNQ